MNSSTADQLQRFIFDNTDIRGELVTLNDTVKSIMDLHNYPLPIRQILGEFISAATLLSSTLKFAGILTIQARGDGDLPLIVAEVSHQKKVRALAQFNEDVDLSGRSLSSLIGNGVLSISIDPDKGERYQGIVALDRDNLAQCLEGYFEQSEQLPTRIWLASDGETAGGILLQRLPQQIATSEVNDEQWETQVHLTSTVTEQELLTLDQQVLLTRLFHESDVLLFDPDPIVFACSCSKVRSGRALKHLPKNELYDIIDEEGSVKVDCHFCGYQYTYNRADIDQLFAPETQH